MLTVWSYNHNVTSLNHQNCLKSTSVKNIKRFYFMLTSCKIDDELNFAPLRNAGFFRLFCDSTLPPAGHPGDLHYVLQLSLCI